MLDWRRRVADLYREVRERAELNPSAALAHFRDVRDELFRSHPDSPISPERRVGFPGLPWWPYDPAWRLEATVRPAPPDRIVVHSGTGEPFTLVRLGSVDTPVGPLDVHWVEVYGGGLFLPFADATNGHGTYGGGRYLLDTVKGADLGGHGATLVLDFNFAYHPSCAYDPRWSCPLAPPGNRLDALVPAGERLAP